MAIRILHPLFSLLASVTRQELARHVAYLKEENRILRARLNDVVCTSRLGGLLNSYSRRAA